MPVVETLQTLTSRVREGIKYVIEGKTPAWTMKDGKDLGLREHNFHLRSAFGRILEDHGTLVGKEIMVGLTPTPEGKRLLIIRGMFHPDWEEYKKDTEEDGFDVKTMPRREWLYVDGFKPITIEGPNFRWSNEFEGKSFRNRFVFPAEYSQKPYVSVTLQGGEQQRVDLSIEEIESGLMGYIHSLKDPQTYVAELSQEWVELFLANYAKMPNEERAERLEAPYFENKQLLIGSC